MSRDQFWLTEAQFSKIGPHLPTDTRGKPRVDDRRVISAVDRCLENLRRKMAFEGRPLYEDRDARLSILAAA
jgi:hypothetical protein